MAPSAPEQSSPVSLNAGHASITIHLAKDRHKTIRLRVKPDGAVCVRAPFNSRQDHILAWLSTRTDWILERQAYFARLREIRPAPGYAPGDIQRFLGQEYPLHISTHVRACIHLNAQGFHIQTRGTPSPAKIKTLLDTWFQTQAATLFTERLNAWLPHLHAQTGPLPTPSLKIRPLRSRFGTCSHHGVITLSRHLAATPLACIDYVLVHELCHLKHFAHNPPFYHLLQTLLPDWRERKNLLKEHWLTLF